MTARITATTASRSFSEILSRVQHHGDHFVILRGGVEVAELRPVAPAGLATLRELLARLAEIPGPDDAMAADLEAVQAAQTAAPGDPWAS